MRGRLLLFLSLCALEACSFLILKSSRLEGSIVQVGTWADLEKAPRIKLLGGGDARLGVDFHECEVHSGIQFYCLTEGFRIPARWTGKRLGPFQVYIDPQADGVAQSVERQAARRPEQSGRALFMMLVPIPTEGKTSLEIAGSKGALVARVSILGLSRTRASWMPWAKNDKPQELRPAKPGETDAGVGYVANPAKGLALPYWDGLIPLPVPSALDDTPLPTLLPEEIDPDFNLSKNGDDLIVESRKRFLVVRPDWHFLTRWWVNENPVIPEQVDAWMDHNGVISRGRKVYIAMDFEPGRIEAKTGDRVAVQLLYVESGWTFTSLLLDHAITAGPGPDVRLSNRIEWTVP